MGRKKINHQVFRCRRKSPSETSMKSCNQNLAFYTYQVPNSSQRQTHSHTTHHSRFSPDYPKPSKPTILVCPKVLKSHPIHGEDPVPTSWRWISKKNPKPNGTHIHPQIRWKQHPLQWHLHPAMLMLQHLAQRCHRRDLKSLHLCTNTGVNICSRWF